MENRSQWIWLSRGESIDQYAEFYDSFDFQGRQASLQISVDSNYAVYVNGSLVYSGQYADFPHYKIYDELDLTAYCHQGINHLAIIVWHYGKGNMGYYPGKAALRYALYLDHVLCCWSDENTLSRQSLCYACGRAKNITSQLGFGFEYDLNREDNWMFGKLNGFSHSQIIEQSLPLFHRPVARPVLQPPAQARIIKNEDNKHYLLDLGREEAGFLMLRARSLEAQSVLVAYGEHIVDGGVRYLIGSRDFSVHIHLRPGLNEYVNPFRRLGLRYLELFAEKPLQLETLTVLPVEYPIKPAAKLPAMDSLQQRIYDTALRTLHLCMHEHYEDTPWREQALYAMDSRNQMLCGYYAFNEYAFPRANLLLISKDDRPDGLLSICTPSRDNLTIPSFSLHYITAVYEYTIHSGDLSLAREIWPKITHLMSVFIQRMEGGLIPVFEEKCHWNFYEWSPGLDGKLFHQDEKRYDAALNCLFSLALQAMHRLCAMTDQPSRYDQLSKLVNAAVYAQFFDAQRGIFINSTKDDGGSVLVNALAILCSAASDDCARQLAATLASDDHHLTPATLSMLCFQYDALLMTDRKRYAAYVLHDIARKYQKMLDEGATAFWETEKGESDFSNAGSLCHGWSAMPVYYYHLLLQ